MWKFKNKPPYIDNKPTATPRGEASKFSALKFVEIDILWVYYTITFGFSMFRHFWVINFQLLKLHCLAKDQWRGSVPEMRIWSILLIKSDSKWCIHLIKPRSHALIYTRYVNYTYMYNLHPGVKIYLLRVHMILKYFGPTREFILYFEKKTDFCRKPKYDLTFFMLSGQKGCFLIRPSSDGTYYGMVMSVRVSVRPSVRPTLRPSSLRPSIFRHFSPTCFDILSWNFAHDFVLMYYRSSSTLHQFLKELCLFVNLE